MTAGLRAGSAYVDILPKIGSGFGKQIESDIKGEAESSGKSIGSSLGSTIRSAAGLALGAAGVAGGVALFKGVLDEGREAQLVAAQTAAVIKSTGGAAKVSAKDVDTLSNAISKKVGIDDEAIASGENLLLTFTNIRNETGKGNDIFNQSTRVITDMSAALGQDMKSSAIQLGKALNDPVKGITALSRVGVAFTEQQKDQIKGLVAHNDTLGAQKIILAELNKEFGGSAESQATAGKKLGVTFKNIEEQLGGYLLPVMDRFANWLNDELPVAVTFGQQAVEKISRAVREFISGFQEGTDKIGSAQSKWAQWGAVAYEIFDKIRAAVRTIISAWTDGGAVFEGGGWMATLGRTVQQMHPIISAIASFIEEHLKPILIGLAIVIFALEFPVLASIAALLALVVGIRYAYDNFAIFRDAVDVTVSVIRVAAGIIGDVVGYLVTQFSHFAAFIQDIWPSIAEAIRHTVNVIVDIVNFLIDTVTAAWNLWGDDLLRVIRGVWGQIRTNIEFFVNTIKDMIKIVLDVINGDWGKAWDDIKDLLGGAVDFILRTLGNLGNVLGGLLGGAFDAARRVVSLGVDSVLDYFKKLPGRLADVVGDLFGFIPKAFKFAWNQLAGIVGDLPHLKIDAIKVLGKEIFPGVDFHFPELPRLAEGGNVVAGGLAMVGERGAEIVRLPAGAQVLPLGSGSRGDHVIEKHFNLGPVYVTPGVDVQDQFERMEWLAG
jgi:hypothetical protein